MRKARAGFAARNTANTLYGQVMGRKMVAIFTPAALGLLLLGLVFVDLHQFRSGSIDVHVALGRELFV
ncbi:MAG: hypothetical protein ACI8W7_005156, partial [Gammaproteobacteria bacterium]